MKVLEFIIDKTGALIYPSQPPKASIDDITYGTFRNNITLTFFQNIEVTYTPSGKQIITGKDPIISGMTGTITVQSRRTPNSSWDSIQDGVLNLANGDNACFPDGIVSGVNLIPSSVSGCNYIAVRLDRGV